MTILNSKEIITGIKPIKNKPTFNSGGFNKELPLGPHNFPLTKYTDYRIYGYKKDKLTGIKRPEWVRYRGATGKPLYPKTVGLDGFYNVIPLNQVK